MLYKKLEEIDWNSLQEIEDPEKALDFLYNVVYENINECTPKKRRKSIKKLCKYQYPEWYTFDLICDIKNKWRHHKLYKITGSQADYEGFSQYRAQVKLKIASTYEAHQHKLQLNVNDDPKSFWNFVSSKRTKRTKPRIKKDGQELNDSETANYFASYFKSVYSDVKPKLDPVAAEREAGASVSAARVHVGQLGLSEVRAALRRLKPKHSAGPDGIPPYIVKDCSSVFEKPLLHVFNLFLKAGYYPNEWKITRVVPVPKGSAGSDVSEYRPVAVLSTFAKVFESVLHKCIYTQVSPQLVDAQHGFRPGRSTASNLLSFVTYLMPSIDAGQQVDAAYFDFRKAFDMVDNDILLTKLAVMGFTPHLLKFFASYLLDRQQYVEYAGFESKPYYTLSGVSQGSNLGPLEFVLMINDLPAVVKEAKCLLFADDVKLFLSVSDTSHCKRLQGDIDRVIEWSVVNKLHFNFSKCSAMSYSRAREPLQHQYVMDGTVIPRIFHVRDLGIEMVPELTFRKHIIDICSKSFRNLGFILRECKDFKNTAVIKMLYNALVRSRLESSAIIWNPQEAKYCLMVEKIQNKFTRYLYLKEYGIYPYFPLMYPSLFVLGMVGYTRLAVRRDVAVAKYVFMVLRGWLHHPEVLAELGLCAPGRCSGQRRRPLALSVPAARTNLLKFAPISRAINVINSLSDYIDIFNCSLPYFTEVVRMVIECNK